LKNLSTYKKWHEKFIMTNKVKNQTRRKVRADEVCIKVTDGTHNTPKRLKNGYPLITSKQLSDGRISPTDYFINKKDFDEVNRRSKVDQWDVLFGMIGTIGEMVIVKDKNPQFAIKNIGLFKTKRDEVEKHGFVLTPGRYIGIKDAIDDGIPFADKMEKLTTTLKEQFAKEEAMNEEIKKQLAKIGFTI
jgi:type I restriction-modification system DNA methylase subunit